MIKTNVIEKEWEIKMKKKMSLFTVTTWIKAESAEAAKIKITELYPGYEVKSISEVKG